MAISEQRAEPDPDRVPTSEPIMLSGGDGVFSIVIDDGHHRQVYINRDVPRLIDAGEAFE